MGSILCAHNTPLNGNYYVIGTNDDLVAPVYSIRHKQDAFVGVLGQARKTEKTKWKRPKMFMIGLKYENKGYS